MPTYEVTSPSGKKLRINGDTPPTQQQLDEIFLNFEPAPERSFTDKAIGVGEAAASAITGAVAEPVSGLVGLARTLTDGAEAGANRVKEFQQNTTYQPKTEAGKEYLQNVADAPIIKQVGEVMQGASNYAGNTAYELTGSPLVAAIAQALPSAGAEALGFAAGAKIPQNLAAKGARLEAEAMQQANYADAMINADKPRPSAVTDVLASGNRNKIRDIANVDPEFYKALDAVGVNAEPLTSYASRSPQYRGVEQGLAAMPGSFLADAEKAFIKDLSAAAAGLMEKYGASKDAPAASMKWRDASMKSIDSLGQAADEAYDALSKIVDKRQPAVPARTTEFFDEVAGDLPLGIDDPDVPSALKRAYQSIQPRQRVNTETGGTEIIPANYESMDRLRKNIGAAAFKKEGDFKDADSAILKRMYGALTDDLNAMAESQGLLKEVKAGKALVSQRKTLEGQMQELIGKDLQKDIVPVIAGNLKTLSKGSLQRYNDMMKQIPDPKVRQELVMTAINDTFNKTLAGERQFTPTQYISWYNDTLGNKTVRKLLEKDIPKKAMKRLDSLAVISKGMAIAKADKVKTGAILSLLDDKGGMVRRMIGKSAGAAVKAIPGGGLAADAMSEILKGSTKRSDTAGQLLASPEFAYLIRQGVAQGVATGTKAAESLRKAEAKMSRSKQYKDWAETLSADDRAKIASSGLVSFLIAPSNRADTMGSTETKDAKQ